MSGERLSIEGIEFDCVIGVTERERSMKQKIVVDLDLQVDFGAVGRSDLIQDTVDYRAIASRVIGEGQRSKFQLIEALGAHLGRTILDAFPKVKATRVSVEKPGALSAARTVRVLVVSRRRGGR